jgi:hypothetical protein
LALLLLPSVSLADRLSDSGSGKTVPQDYPARASGDFQSRAAADLQNRVLPPGLAVDYASSAPLPATIASFLTEVNPQGVRLDSEGGLTGQATPVPASLQPAEADLIIIPTNRN